jgi:hypothetical protein
MIPLATRADLDELRCSEPDCDGDAPGVMLESACHPEFAMWPHYRHGELTLSCARCGRHVVTIAIAG